MKMIYLMPIIIILLFLGLTMKTQSRTVIGSNHFASAFNATSLSHMTALYKKLWLSQETMRLLCGSVLDKCRLTGRQHFADIIGLSSTTVM